MLSDKPLIGHIYIHVKTKSEYKVIGFGGIKSPNNNLWHTGIFYQKLNGSGSIFGRTIDDFKDNFEDIEDTIET